MDDATIQGLKQAYLLSPENQALLLVLLRAHLDRDEAGEAYALIAQREPQDVAVAEEDRVIFARACLEAGHALEALEWAEGTSPLLAMCRAQALAQLERLQEGREAYQQAIAANSALEDQALWARLSGRVRAIAPRGANGPRLTVISNDDTRQYEVERALQPKAERITFADIGGLDDIKEQIRRKIILPFQKPGLFQRFRKKAGGGILLYGPPGCGKTLLARATAGECDARFHNVAIADVLDMYIGESERKLQAIFDKARETTPCVLFFDEIEALGGKRQYSREATSAKVVSQFLAEMDGFAQNNAGVLVLGATNVPWAVDSAFRRPGRFDRVQFVPPPDRVARKSILGLLLHDRPAAPGIDTGYLAQNTPGFSGADLRNLVETAVEQAIERSIDKGEEMPITQDDLRKALKDVKPTTLEWLTTARNYARYANEAGQYDDVLAFLEKNAKS
jgi:transitional endoplasmic reticulum ATPase